MDKYITELSRRLNKLNARSLALIIIFLIIVIWGLDYVSGPYLSTSIFYLLPVSLAAWWFSKRDALVVSLVCASIWLLTDISTNPHTPNPLIPYWNALVRLGFFVVVTLSLSSLQEARKHQEELLAFIVHDLRSPLGNILMSLTFVKESQQVDPTIGKILDTSISSSQKMLIQVNSLLDLTQLENHKMPVLQSDFQAATLLQQAVNQVAALAEVKQIQLNVDYSLGNTLVCADENLSVRVLVNLLNNGIKFSPMNTTLLVTTIMTNDMLTVGVQDEGSGIPIQWHKRIFDKYEQVQSRQNGSSMGSGLGLAFCKLAVEAQNGRIWVEMPENGTGTRICFSLPLSSLENSIHTSFAQSPV